ncbi:MAG: hypothetical protein IJC73_02435, partial [Lentisphaeria bacterium]|nr:hypothetical protein [Lentisphaeria bacterium]
MVDYYVLYGEDRYDFTDLAGAQAKALELGANSVLYISGGQGPTSGNVKLNGITTVIENHSCREFIGGAEGGGFESVDQVNVTFNSSTVTSYIYCSGVNTPVLKSSTITINDGCKISLIAATIVGPCDVDVTVNVNGGSVNTVGAFATKSGYTINGDFTVNLAGGTINDLFPLSSAKSVTGTINGNVYVNMSGGRIGNRFMTSEASSSTVLNGNVYYTLTGGSAKAHIYGSGKGNDVIKGSVNILVDGFVSGDGTWIYGSSKGKVEGGVNMTMKSGYVRMLTGGGCDGDQAYNVVINMEGGKADYITGACYQNYTLTGDVEINVTGGSVLHTFNGAGNKIGSMLKGNVVTNISGDTTLIHTGDFNISGSGMQEGNATMNISGGTIDSIVSGLGSRSGCGITGNLELNISGGTFTNQLAAILGCGYSGSVLEGGVIGDLTITITGGVFAGSIYLIGGAIGQVGNSTMTIGEVSIGGGVYAGSCGWPVGSSWTADTKEEDLVAAYVEGNQSITVDGTNIAGALSGAGTFAMEGLEENTSVLTVGSKGVTVGGAVSDFDNITIAAGATIEAGSVTASAITATAAAEDGAYLLATGFAAQDSVITVL